MGQYSSLLKLGAQVWGGSELLKASRQRRPRAEPAPSLPDKDALDLEARRRRARLAVRGGRVSTILDDEQTLG